MALKAGRVGVAKDQVDEFGHITGGGTPENVYTKSQCDNKFETKTHAGNTYQPMTLEVPITLLNGSVVNKVEDALQGINSQSSSGGGFTKGDLIPNSSASTVEQDMLRKQDNVCFMVGRIHIITVDSNTVVATIPEGFRPTNDLEFMVDLAGMAKRMRISSSTGQITFTESFSGMNCDVCIGWLV